MIAIGARTVWLRPRNRALSVSNSGAPTASPSMTVKCAAQISGSPGRPLSPRGEDGSDIGKIFRFDEQLREGGMRDVGALGRQDEFGVGRDLDVARAASGIRDRYPANFGIVLGGDDYVQSRRQRAVAARDLGAVLIEDDGVAIRFDAAGLKARRPHNASAQVFDIDVEARVVAGRVLAPARQRPYRPSGCIPSRRRSASSSSGRSRADAWRASPVARRRTGDRPTVRRRARRQPTSRPPPKDASPRRRGACAPAEAVRSP